MGDLLAHNQSTLPALNAWDLRMWSQGLEIASPGVAQFGTIDLTRRAEVDLKKIEEKLKAPFPESDVQWRISRVGESNGRIWAKVLAYIDARAIQDRLDEVLGVHGWAIRYEHTSGGIMCGISLNLNGAPDPSLWPTKWDGADPTDVEPFKGGISSAMKRAASVWGLGRYLYSIEESFAEVSKEKFDGAIYHKDGKGNQFFWKPPRLPQWALPASNVAKKPTGDAGKASQPTAADAPRAATAPEGTLPSAGQSDLIPYGRYKGRNPWEIGEAELKDYLDDILKAPDLSRLPQEAKTTITMIGARLGKTIKFNK